MIETVPFTGKKLVGTARYSSINSHNGIELSRRDDLESFMYLLIYLRKGNLPWQGLPGRNREEKYESIRQRKINTTIDTLCHGLPVQFAHFLKHVRSLNFKEKPKGDGGMINGGFFVLSPEIVSLIDGDDTSFEEGPLESLAKKGELMAFEHRGFWHPMDTLRDKFYLNKLWDEGRAPWKVWV